MKKVLVLTSSYPKFKGDINGNFVYELAKRLKNDFDIHVLAPAFKNSLLYEEDDGIKIHRHKQFPVNGVELAYGTDILAKIKKNKLFILVVPFYLLMQFIALARVVKKEKIELIHAHWIIPQGVIAVLYKLLFNRKIKILATIHGADINSFNNSLGTLLKKIVLNNIDKLTVVSNALKNKALEYDYKKEVYVYPMGVDTELFSKNKSKEKNTGNNDISLLFVGGIIERKGIRLLIEAMPDIIKSSPSIKLQIIGEGNLKPELERRVKELGIISNVIFLGPIANAKLNSYYSSADVFVLPSYSEGFGLVVTEAMSSECLTLTSDLPPIKDIIDNNINGFSLHKLDSENISKSVLKILSLEEKEKKRVKENAREKIVSNFDWKIVSKNYRSLYQQLL